MVKTTRDCLKCPTPEWSILQTDGGQFCGKHEKRRDFSPSSLGGVVGVVAFVEWVVGMVLFVPSGGEVGVALIPGFWCGVGGGRVSKQFISGSSFAAKGLRANEHRLSHDLDAML